MNTELSLHQEQVLDELESLVDTSFKVPAGLYIPLGNRLLVKEVYQKEQKTAAGVIMPGTPTLQNARIGIVYRIGNGVTLPITEGMCVAFEKTAFAGIFHNGSAYIDLMDHQVYSVVPPENYMSPYVPTKEHIRRQSRIDSTKKGLERTNKKIDEINNS